MNKVTNSMETVHQCVQSDQAAFTQDVDIQVTVPSSYTQTGKSVRTNGNGAQQAAEQLA